MSDSIFMRSLLSYKWLEQICAEHAWADLHGFAEPEQVAWLWFRLRKLPDDQFPYGKWATLQAIEELLDKAALEEK
jgi:hypothetical protein